MDKDIFKEAKRLHRLGFAIIWLKPKSKRPVESGWTTGPRKPWAYLASTYKNGYNVGVRTGQPSKVEGGYLACIDVDVKDPKCLRDAESCLLGLVGSAHWPEVRSGSGKGSRHLYCRTREAFKMVTVAKHEGWEICIYSDGRQMALPPSVHPDTGRTYAWKNPLEGELPELDGGVVDKCSIQVSTKGSVAGRAGAAGVVGKKANSGAKTPREAEERSDSLEGSFDFKVVPVDLDWRVEISDKVLKGIKDGTDIVDRSGFLLPAASALYSAGLCRDEILSVLTDHSNFLAACAYDHAQTRDRTKAAEWLWKYTVRKVFAERSAASVFSKVPPGGRGGSGADSVEPLTAEQIEEQTAEILADINWKQNLSKTKQGYVLPTVHNVVLILKNDVDSTIVRRNEFAFRDAYSVGTPWGGVKNASLTDDDTAKIKHWFGSTWGMEPGNGPISDALTVIACDNAFDPVRDWLDGIPEWDGVNRLDTWLIDHFGASGDPEYLGQVFRKWLTAMVMRIYRPGAKFDWMPIFEGAQGVGKSSFGRVLVGDEYFLDWLPNLGDKDAALGLQGMWAVEMGELSQFRKNELEIIKAFLTRTVDKFRPPHGKKLIESPRRCVFFGTTNKSEYLRDDSGNRRFKPVKVGKLDFECLRADRMQLFAEALVHARKSSELDLELTGQARVFELEIHQEKMVEDESVMMAESMQDFLQKSAEKREGFDLNKFRISDLFSGVGPLGKWRSDTRNLMFASKMLKKVGAEKRFVKGYSYWKLDPGPTHQEEDFI